MSKLFTIEGKNADGETIRTPLAATFDGAGNNIAEHYATKAELASAMDGRFAIIFEGDVELTDEFLLINFSGSPRFFIVRVWTANTGFTNHFFDATSEAQSSLAWSYDAGGRWQLSVVAGSVFRIRARFSTDLNNKVLSRVVAVY